MAPVLKEITTPLARELAEYTLLHKDLQAAHEAIALWFAKYMSRQAELTPEEVLIAQSLFRDSIVMFVGCFDNTAPCRLVASDIYQKPNKELEYFEWLKDIRDSYAAHKFGPLRQCVVGVMVDENGAIVGAGNSTRIYAGPVGETKDDLLSIVNIAGSHVEKKILELSNQMTTAALAMSPAELAALKPGITHDVEPHQVRISRDKFRRSLSTPDKG